MPVDHRGTRGLMFLSDPLLLWPDAHGVDVVWFTTEAGAPLYGPNLTREFQALFEAAGLPRQRFHDLRHAAASFMLAEGVPLKVAQEVLGHSTIAVTADIYSHVMPAATRDATERVGALLRAGA